MFTITFGTSLVFIFFLNIYHGSFSFAVDYRLPKRLTPIKYYLNLSLPYAEEKIKSQVHIELMCEESTSEIVLHSNPLFITIQLAVIENSIHGRHFLEPPIIFWDKQIILFNSPIALQKGMVYHLILWYHTAYSDSSKGIRKIYDKENGVWITTLFEPIFARELFPCFDEPYWRSAFTLELWLYDMFAKEGYMALSNTDGKHKQWNSNLSIWNFEPTPPIPTYLFTISIGKFSSVCVPERMSDKEICIWRFSSIVNWQSTGLRIIKLMQKFQESMANYLDCHPGARLHLLVVPSEINGMENFGLLTIKESLWPSNENNETTEMAAFVLILLHEMVHQWFGNLVTMEWWDDIWLSESITSFLSMIFDQKIDVLSDSSTMALVNASWIAERMPRTVYRKGAVVLRMLDEVIGSRASRKIFRKYIREYQWKSVNTTVFLKILDNVVQHPFPLSNFLSTWLYQGSYPVVFVDYDRELKQFCLSQQPKHGNFYTRWYIPIWIGCSLNLTTEHLYWLLPTSQLLLNLSDVTTGSKPNSVIFNHYHSAYYEVIKRYDSTT